MNDPEARRAAPRRLRAAALAVALAALLGAGAVHAEATLAGVVNVNTASSEELAMLPGIGVSKAHAILAERERRGRFEAVEDLLEVKGIGPSALERIRPYVAVKGRSNLEVR